MSGEIVRMDSKIRLLGNRSYVGDQEIIGILKVLDRNENIIMEFDPDAQIFYLRDASGNTIMSVDAANQLFRLWDTAGNSVFRVDTSTGILQMRDQADVVVLQFDPSTGDLTINGDPINTNAEIFSHLSVEHFWTGSGTYIDRTGTYFKIDGDNFQNQTVKFETVMAVEQSGRTAYTRIYNITDSNVLTGSEITSTRVGVSNPEAIRSGTLTFPSGEKQYKLQIKQSPAGNGGDNAHFYAARLVITQG